MSSNSSPSWKPSPELLAAYADGELDARDDAVELRRRIEAYLETNVEARAELAELRRLNQLWRKTAPAKPKNDVWAPILDHLATMPLPAPEPASRRTTWGFAAAAVAACVAWAFLLAGSFQRNPVVPSEIFAVVSPNEIEILHVEGAFMNDMMVGHLPLHGTLELVGPGEVVVTSVQPARRDRMMPVVHLEGALRPMIWAKRDADEE